MKMEIRTAIPPVGVSKIPGVPERIRAKTQKFRKADSETKTTQLGRTSDSKSFRSYTLFFEGVSDRTAYSHLQVQPDIRVA
ncbi:hypothetical protein ACHQM5_009838 [Ranunculus cassubicifolius]